MLHLLLKNKNYLIGFFFGYFTAQKRIRKLRGTGSYIAKAKIDSEREWSRHFGDEEVMSEAIKGFSEKNGKIALKKKK